MGGLRARGPWLRTRTASLVLLVAGLALTGLPPPLLAQTTPGRSGAGPESPADAAAGDASRPEGDGEGHARLRRDRRRGRRSGEPPRPLGPLRAFSPCAPRSSPASRWPSISSRDEIVFFPVLYWPVLENAKPLPERTLAKIDAYMKQGGMIIFDTRDAGSAVPAGGQIGGRNGPALQRLLGLARPAAPRARARDPRAHQVVLPLALVSGPLGRRPALGRGGRRERRGGPQGAPRRRRHLDPHHVQRFRRRLGARHLGPAALSRSCPAARTSASSRSAPASTSSCMR